MSLLAWWEVDYFVTQKGSHNFIKSTKRLFQSDHFWLHVIMQVEEMEEIYLYKFLHIIDVYVSSNYCWQWELTDLFFLTHSLLKWWCIDQYCNLSLNDMRHQPVQIYKNGLETHWLDRGLAVREQQCDIIVKLLILEECLLWFISKYSYNTRKK